MTDPDARAQAKGYLVLLRHAVEHVTEPTTADSIFRELNGLCHKLVPKSRPGHALVTQIVPDAQLTLWQDFARGMKREMSTTAGRSGDAGG